MRHRQILVATAISCLFTSACNKVEEAPSANDTGAVSVPEKTVTAMVDVADWAGKWTGPEGLYVNITPGTGGKVALEMQSDLDTKGSYDATATADGISFKRGDEMLTLKKATGDETGLKYLAGKKDCLMVKSGEGFCRD